MSFNISKPFKRRDGREILWWVILIRFYGGERRDKIVYTIEGEGGNHVLQEVYLHSGLEKLGSLTMRESDLVNVPEYEWCNYYPHGEVGYWYESKDKSLEYAGDDPHFLMRRVKGSEAPKDFELLPLDTELE